jgi:hypothetical protein
LLCLIHVDVFVPITIYVIDGYTCFIIDDHIIHADVYGPITINVIVRYTCFIIDDHIGYVHMYLIKVWII